MGISKKLVILSSSCLLLSAQTLAFEKQGNLLDTMARCRALEPGDRRLSCYDAAMAALAPAIADGSIAALDRRAQQNNQRRDFGRTGRKSASAEDEQLKEMRSTITHLAPNMDGSWNVGLADGSVWRTIGVLNGRLGVGKDIIVVRGAFSRYTLSTGSGRKTIVRRIA